jgi:hypothetical protein
MSLEVKEEASGLRASKRKNKGRELCIFLLLSIYKFLIKGAFGMAPKILRNRNASVSP